MICYLDSKEQSPLENKKEIIIKLFPELKDETPVTPDPVTPEPTYTAVADPTGDPSHSLLSENQRNARIDDHAAVLQSRSRHPPFRSALQMVAGRSGFHQLVRSQTPRHAEGQPASLPVAFLHVEA